MPPTSAAPFWQNRWETKQIGFHEGKPNRHLVEHWRVEPAARVLVPLCGASEDLACLAARGHSVVGVELVELAIRRFFDDHGLVPRVESGQHPRWSAGGVTLVQADILAVSAEVLGPVHALYDRAALIALPPAVRPVYVAHLRRLLAPNSEGLLVSFAHDPCDREGPPFPVLDEEVRALWPGAEKLAEEAVNEERWAAVPNVRETVWRVST
jgi:thiopurine S-methyltransferase